MNKLNLSSLTLTTLGMTLSTAGKIVSSKLAVCHLVAEVFVDRGVLNCKTAGFRPMKNLDRDRSPSTRARPPVGPFQGSQVLRLRTILCKARSAESIPLARGAGFKTTYCQNICIVERGTIFSVANLTFFNFSPLVAFGYPLH